MKTFKTAKALRKALPKDKTIAYVPTMGALHAGHMALIEAAVALHDVVVASIFVNPTQFNDAGDLEAYPRTPKSDAALLKKHGCKYLYFPSVKDVYPEGTGKSSARSIDFGALTATMEGANRPGHFDGVAQVVSRLLDIVQPTTLVLGQKDYQQVAVIRAMIKQLRIPVKVEVVPTVRAKDGLALSSRNKRLNGKERQAAGLINVQLAAVTAGLAAGWPVEVLRQLALGGIGQHDLLDPEYIQIFDGDTLLPYEDGNEVRELVVATAVHCGPVRLIDNRIVGSNHNP